MTKYEIKTLEFTIALELSKELGGELCPWQHLDQNGRVHFKYPSYKNQYSLSKLKIENGDLIVETYFDQNTIKIPWPLEDPAFSIKNVAKSIRESIGMVLFRRTETS